MAYVEFYNTHLGTRMQVAEDRVDFYKAMGHIPVADLAEEPVKKAEIVAEVKEPEEVKKPAKRKR